VSRLTLAVGIASETPKVPPDVPEQPPDKPFEPEPERLPPRDKPKPIDDPRPQKPPKWSRHARAAAFVHGAYGGVEHAH